MGRCWFNRPLCKGKKRGGKRIQLKWRGSLAVKNFRVLGCVQDGCGHPRMNTFKHAGACLM
eukprot:scaffold115879_cov14-Tisochrysis_lutea.AAC.2